MTLKKSQHRKLSLEKKILQPLLPGFDSQPFDHKSSTLSTELPLSYLITVGFYLVCVYECVFVGYILTIVL